jgi:hypothetical protein
MGLWTPKGPRWFRGHTMKMETVAICCHSIFIKVKHIYFARSGVYSSMKKGMNLRRTADRLNLNSYGEEF